MAATQAETGRPLPASIDDLPAVLRRECCDLPAVYDPPGALLIADLGGQAVGCVGLAPCPGEGEGVAEIRRLYVRPAYRGKGIARALMSRAHGHAAEQGMSRLILDVLPSRVGAIALYRRLGYTKAEHRAAHSPGPMICLERPVTTAVRCWQR
jgi:putative acetyltransferase